MRECIVSLIWQTEKGEEKQEVFAEIESVGSKEFYDAAQNGMKPQKKITVWREEYAGEEIAEIVKKRYAVYRTYERTDGKIELYLTAKAGI